MKALASMPLKIVPFIVQTDGQSVSVSGLKDGEVVSLYNVSGVLLSKGKAAAGVAKS